MDITQTLELLLVIAIVFVVVMFILVRVIMPMIIRQRQAEISGGTAWTNDRAWNQIQAGNGMADFLEREGVVVTEARMLLEQALLKHEIKRYPESYKLAKQATDLLTTQRQRLKLASSPAKVKGELTVGRKVEEPEPEPPAYRDLAHRVGDPEPEPTTSRVTPGSKPSAVHPDDDRQEGERKHEDEPMQDGEEEGTEESSEPEEPTIASEKAKRPKDYMEARFMLSSLRNDLEQVPPERMKDPALKEARDWAQKSQVAFDRKDYTESLRLAMRGRRRMGGTGISTISVGAGTVVESPPEEISPSAQRSSAPPMATQVAALPGTAPTSPPGKVACGRCGRVNTPGDRFCRGCGAPLAPPKCPRCQRPVEADDKFCHACGSPLGTGA